MNFLFSLQISVNDDNLKKTLSPYFIKNIKKQAEDAGYIPIFLTGV